MKKRIRLISAVAVIGMCLSLCGCKILDELQASRASITANGVIQLYDGTEYMLLPECRELSPDFSEYESIYIAEEELPLLLTSFSENYAEKSNDGRFLQVFTEETVVYYCRSDIYDSMLERINNGFVPEVYCYSYYDYESGNYILYSLTPAQANAVEQVYTTQKPEKLPAAATLDYEYMVDLYLYTNDHLFMQDTVDICLAEGKYYVVAYGNTIYSVPDEQSPVFAEIMEKEIALYSNFYD